MLCDGCTEEIVGNPTDMGYGMIWCAACVADPDRGQRRTLRKELEDVDARIGQLVRKRAMLDGRKSQIEGDMRRLRPEPAGAKG